jgi:purine catabolism regulator
VAGWLGVPVMITDADGLIAGAAPAGARESSGGRLDVRSIPHAEDDVLASGPDVTAACIRSGATVQGYLLAETRGHELTVGQALALRRAAPVVALAFARASEVAAVEARYRGDFLRAVLAGTTRADQDVHEHAGRLGWALDGELVVGVGEPADLGPDAGPGEVSARIARVLERELCRRWPGAVVHGYASEVVAIMPADARDHLDAVVRSTRAHLSAAERGFGFGISRVVDDIGGVPTAYRQAREALLIAARDRQGTGFTSFDNIGLARLVAVMAESDQAHTVVADALQPLLSDRNGHDLLATLESFLSHNCNVAATARELHFHYNTVRYRVSRIEELLGPFVDDAERRAELMAACGLRRALQRRL